MCYNADDNEASILIRAKYWSKIRGDLFKKIGRGKGGSTQWGYLAGIRSWHNGHRIRLTDENKAALEKVVDYLNATEGRDELLDLGILRPPEDTDELISIIQEAKTDRQIKKEELRLFLKHKMKILRYLSKTL